MNKKILFIFCVFFSNALFGQEEVLQSGPMVGYSTMREVLLWAQTKESATVHFEYWKAENPKKRFLTSQVTTEKDRAFVAKVVADQLEPGSRYQYQLFINKKPVKFDYELAFQTQALWQFRTDPPDFRFVLGSCSYFTDPPYDRPGKPYGGGYEIFSQIYKQKPDFMLWMGDNAYLTEADWNSRTGIFHRYTHGRSFKGLQPLLGSTHHYAIWDDHDYGPNDSDRGFWNKDITLEAFNLFWGNPNINLTGMGGITGTFSWGDVQFFLLDNRWFRAPNGDTSESKPLIGEYQLQWLKDVLTTSRATFKFIVIGGKVIDSEKRFENYDGYPEEKKKLMKVIQESGAKGVMFLTGDIHHTELSVDKTAGAYPLYDLTISPLTAGIYPTEPENKLLVPGTFYNDRNFGVVEVSGPRKDRVLLIKVFDKSGKNVWEKQIKASELR